MGNEMNEELANELKDDINTNVNRNSFKFISVIGKGAYGKVWKARHIKYQTDFTVKEMLKAKIVDEQEEDNIKRERNILAKINHKFIVNMEFSFQDDEHLYIVLEYLQGGDLRYHLTKRKTFSEEVSKFFTECIILGLEYLHHNKVIHRDIKPENIMLDIYGYAKITDFGIARIQAPNNKEDSCGTPGYMAPEVICCQNHTVVSDYFSLGVMLYEFMNGTRPYTGKSRKEIKQNILMHQVQINKNVNPYNWSDESIDFINRLLQRKPHKRLGVHGIEDIKEHPWLADFSFRDLYNLNLHSPFTIKDDKNYDEKYCNMADEVDSDTDARYRLLSKAKKFTHIFDDFLTFNRYHLNYNLMNNPSIKVDAFDNIHRLLEDGGKENEYLTTSTSINKRSSRNTYNNRSSIPGMNSLNLNPKSSNK